MTEQNDAPHVELDPATTGTTAKHEQDKDEHDKPRDSKGWDGKLRVDKNVVVKYPADPNAEPHSDAEESEDEGPPPDEIQADEDLLDDMPDDEDEIELVHCKIADMGKLRLERFKQMKVPKSSIGQRTIANSCSVSACDKTAYKRSTYRTTLPQL
jgi:protein phosphatase 1 regulatory subunit 7